MSANDGDAEDAYEDDSDYVRPVKVIDDDGDENHLDDGSLDQ